MWRIGFYAYSESCEDKSNLDSNYTFTINWTPNGLQFGAKLVGKSGITI